MHSLTLNIWPKAVAPLFRLFKWEIVNRSIFNSGGYNIVFINDFTSPGITIFPWQEWTSVPLLLSQQCEHNRIQSLSHRNTVKIPPALTHISSDTLSWAAKLPLCCFLHGRSSVGGWGMQPWQCCSRKRLLLVFLVISRTAHARSTLQVWWWRVFPFTLMLSSLMVWTFLQGKQVSTC